MIQKQIILILFAMKKISVYTIFFFIVHVRGMFPDFQLREFQNRSKFSFNFEHIKSFCSWYLKYQ